MSDYVQTTLDGGEVPHVSEPGEIVAGVGPVRAPSTRLSEEPGTLVPLGRSLVEVDRELDALYNRRVAAHRGRAGGGWSEARYLEELRAVRGPIDELEEERRALGAAHSRGYERCVPEMVARGWSETVGWGRPPG